MMVLWTAAAHPPTQVHVSFRLLVVDVVNVAPQGGISGWRTHRDAIVFPRRPRVATDGLFGEDLVDAMRAEKDAELAQYVESAARKARRHKYGCILDRLLAC